MSSCSYIANAVCIKALPLSILANRPPCDRISVEFGRRSLSGRRLGHGPALLSARLLPRLSRTRRPRRFDHRRLGTTRSCPPPDRFDRQSEPLFDPPPPFGFACRPFERRSPRVEVVVVRHSSTCHARRPGALRQPVARCRETDLACMVGRRVVV